MDKLEIFRGLIGDELYNKFLDAVGKKEGAAAVAGMVAKETKEDVASEGTQEGEKEQAQTETQTNDTPDEALVDAFATALKPLTEGLDSLAASVKAANDAIASASKAAADAQTALDKRLSAVETAAKDAVAGVKELKGELPRSAKKERASESDGNVVDVKKEGPKADPNNEFEAFLFGNQE